MAEPIDVLQALLEKHCDEDEEPDVRNNEVDHYFYFDRIQDPADLDAIDEDAVEEESEGEDDEEELKKLQEKFRKKGRKGKGGAAKKGKKKSK